MTRPGALVYARREEYVGISGWHQYHTSNVDWVTNRMTRRKRPYVALSSFAWFVCVHVAVFLGSYAYIYSGDTATVFYWSTS